MDKQQETKLRNIIRAAREVQEFLWGEQNTKFGFEEWRRMFRKRVVKLDEIDASNPYAIIELKKRVLQVGALAVALLARLEKDGILPDHLPNEPTSNLHQYTKLKEE